MTATNGYSAFGARRHLRLLGCAIALLALSAMTMPSIAGASGPKKVYIGLGDSLAFGYSTELFNTNLPTEPKEGFETGFVNDYYNAETNPATTSLVNYGCPGETTASMIGNKGAGAAVVGKLKKEKLISKTATVTEEAPCAYHETVVGPWTKKKYKKDALVTEGGHVYAAMVAETDEEKPTAKPADWKDLGVSPPTYQFPLHNEYGVAGTSQLEAAVAKIKQTTAEGKKVSAITLDIGANDELHAVAAIEAEAHAFLKHRVELAVEPLVHEAIAFKLKAIVTPEVEAFVVEQAIKRLEKLGVEDGEKYAAEHAAELEAAFYECVGNEIYVEGHSEAEAIANCKAKGEAFVAERAKEEVEAFVGSILIPFLTKLGEEDGAKYAAEHAAELEAAFYECVGNEIYVEGHSEAEAIANCKAKGEAFVKGKAEEEVGEYVVAHGGLEALGLELVVTKFAGEYAVAHAGELELLGLALENEYLAEHKAEVEMEGYEIGLEKAAEFQVTHAAELEKEGLEIVVAGLKKAAPALFAQIETNLIAIVYDLRKYAPKAKINFLATYDPYGRLTGPTELLPGSNELNEELNLQEKSKLKAKVLKGCVANPRPDFNPGTFPAEAVALATLTNMANTNHTNGKADGPDIHPTKLGYEKLAEALKNQCKY